MGKGSRQRAESKYGAYAAGWERIFGGKWKEPTKEFLKERHREGQADQWAQTFNKLQKE